MSEFDYDLFVIGGGSGGVRAARMAAETGAKVAIAEAYRFGGTCVIRGCIPKKLMWYASHFREAFDDSRGYGWSIGEPEHDWGRMIAAKDREIARLESVYARNINSAGGEILRDRAIVAGPHEVRLERAGRVVSAKHILIAVGGEPFVPNWPGRELALTSDEMFDLKARPGRALVVGGGYIACEFAGILHGLGVETTLAYRGERILKTFDRDLSEHVTEAYRRKGIDVRLKADVERLDQDAAGVMTTLSDGARPVTDIVLAATGRKPSTRGLGLEQAGVKLAKNGAVQVDRYSQSSVPSIYAVGDVTSRVELTPVAIREGAAFARTVFMGERTPVDHELIASAIFTQPEIGTIGMTEDRARMECECDVYRSVFKPLLHTVSGREERTLMKMIVRREDQRIMGVHLCGYGASEMIQLAAVALKMGAAKADFDRAVAVHPTAAEELVTMRSPVALGSEGMAG